MLGLPGMYSISRLHINIMSGHYNVSCHIWSVSESVRKLVSYSQLVIELVYGF